MQGLKEAGVFRDILSAGVDKPVVKTDTSLDSDSTLGGAVADKGVRTLVDSGSQMEAVLRRKLTRGLKTVPDRAGDLRVD